MDQLMMALEIVHIVFGVLWVGTLFFAVLFLEPQLKKLGPTFEGPVMRALMPVVSPSMNVASVLTIGSGVAQALLMRRADLGGFLSSGWGWAILIGFVATAITFTIGQAMVMPLGLRMNKLGRSMAGRAPTPEEQQEMAGLSSRLASLTRVEAALVLVAIGAMAATRFV